jgi:2-polyprenyl-3-methyl-5-hydroxy-6-metoxy-1,4-benzoquinol methylase
MQPGKSREQRWKEEAQFFDEQAAKEAAAIQPVNPLVLERYGKLQRRRFNKENRFRILGDLRGKKVLDVGCGDGLNVVTLAKLGAQVTGIDISPGAIDLARRRVDINGLTGSVRLLCSPIETADTQDGTFDIIWGDAVLHHLIEVLEPTMVQLRRCLKPGGMMIFSEPVNFNQTLRRLRFLFPAGGDFTPDERPLEPPEIEIVRRHIPDVRMRWYHLFDRVGQFIIPNHQYETASALQKALVNAVAFMDYGALSVPFLQSLGGVCVIWGRVPGGETGARS